MVSNALRYFYWTRIAKGTGLRIANLDGRLAVLTSGGAVDVNIHSRDRFPADPAAIYPMWEEFVAWAAGSIDQLDPQLGQPFDEDTLQPPSPRPQQVFAVGLNYAPHAAEAGLARPEHPLVFTKFPSALAGPTSPVPLPSDTVDWEIELVAVIARRAYRVPVEDGWSYIAGLTIGQDFSDREVQARGPAPQYSLGKSFPNFAPTGPWLVTPDELADRDDISVECFIDDELVQRGRTSELIFSVPELIAYISAICPLLPGDVLFTGTPEGTGAGRTPPRFLRPGERVVSRIEGIGTMRNECVAVTAALPS